MTIETTNRVEVYRGNGITTVWPWNFRIDSAEELSVSIQNYATGEIEEVLSPGSYTATGFGNSAGGMVTYPISGTPLDSSQAIVLTRTVPYTQELDIPDYSGFNPTVVENQLDRIVMQIQQIAELQSRGVYVNPGQTPPDATAIINAAAYAEAALAAANAGFVFDTEANFLAANIPLVLTFVRVAGYAAPGDGGGHFKRRIATPGSPKAWHKQSADGAWWELDEDVIDPRMFGAKLNDSTFDSGPAIQAAIDAGSFGNTAVPVKFAPGRYYIGQTLRIYAQSVIYGYGKKISRIQTLDDVDIGMLETDGFLDLIDTTTKFINDPGMTWGFVIKDLGFDGNRTNNYGGVSGTRYGGVATDEWDGFGVRLYGRAYVIENVEITQCAGIGFYSECGNPTFPYTDPDWYYKVDNNQQGYIRGLSINNCSYEGFVYRGPGDVRVEDATAELCCYPDETLFGTLVNSLMFPTEGIRGMVWADKAINNAVAGCEIGFIHSHTHKNGYCIGLEGNVFLRLRTENFVAEGGLGQIKARGTILGQWNKVNVRNNNVGDGSLPDIDLESSRRLYVAEVENLGASGNQGSTKLRIGSDDLQFGKVIIVGGGTAGHGVVIDTNVDSVPITDLCVTDLRGNAKDGTASCGLWTKSGTDIIDIGHIRIENCQKGWKNDSTGEIVIRGGRIDADAVTYSGIVPLDLTAVSSKIDECMFITFDGTSKKYPRRRGNVSIDPTITTRQDVSFTHNMWRTPTLNEVTLTLVTNSANGAEPVLRFLQAVAVTSTTVTAKLQFDTAGGGNSGGSALMFRVN